MKYSVDEENKILAVTPPATVQQILQLQLQLTNLYPDMQSWTMAISDGNGPDKMIPFEELKQPPLDPTGEQAV